MRWLIVVDGSDRSEKAIRYAAGLISPETDTVLLVAPGGSGSDAELRAVLDYAKSLLEGCPVEERIIWDALTEAVRRTADDEQVDIVVYGSRGRRGLSRLMLGSVAVHLESHLLCSLLVVRGEPTEIRKILVATSLYPMQQRAMELGGRVATRTGASITLLHVMSQVPLSDTAPETPLQVTAEEAMEEHTREGDELAERLLALEEMGVQTEVKLRHGLVLDEVEAELKAGGYDLLVIGAHRVPPDLPFAKILAVDVAADILMHTQGTVLIA